MPFVPAAGSPPLLANPLRPAPPIKINTVRAVSGGVGDDKGRKARPDWWVYSWDFLGTFPLPICLFIASTTMPLPSRPSMVSDMAGRRTLPRVLPLSEKFRLGP